MIGIGIGVIGAPPRVSPLAVLGSSLAVWARSDQGVTLNGATVSAWADLSGNSRHLLQAVAAAQPTYSATGAPNGRPMLVFDGSNDLLKTAAFTLNQPAEVLISARWNGAAEASPTLFDGDVTNSMRVNKVSGAATTAYMFTTGGGLVTLAVADATWLVYDALFSGASSRFSVNNGSAATGDPGSTNGSGLTIGCAGSGTYVGKVDVAEVIVSTRALTAAERTKLITYMRRYAGF